MSQRKGKATVKQIEATMERRFGAIDSWLHMFMQELDKHNTLILKMLEKDNLIEVQTCPSCAGDIRLPKLEGIDPVDTCPYCNSPIDVNQTTLDDFKEEE
jgi:uncharacterized protein YbaR (Trm112 family)